VGDISVWHCETTQSPIDDLDSLLSPDEHRVARRLRSAEAADVWIRARGVAKLVLAAYTPLSPHEIVFDRRCEHCGDPRHGKPFLEAFPALSFSISRAGSHVLVAVTRQRRVGADIELLQNAGAVEGVRRFALTDREVDVADGLRPDLRRAALVRAWAQKEAFSKAIGLGLALPFGEVDVSLDPREGPRLCGSAEARSDYKGSWSFAERRLGDAVAVSVVDAVSPQWSWLDVG
jgi:phosphopantetheinyl transferase